MAQAATTLTLNRPMRARATSNRLAIPGRLEGPMLHTALDLPVRAAGSRSCSFSLTAISRNDKDRQWFVWDGSTPQKDYLHQIYRHFCTVADVQGSA